MPNLIGIATWNFTQGSLAERIDRYAKMGFDGVSLLAGEAVAMCCGESPEVEEAIRRNNLGVAIHGGLGEKSGPIDEAARLADFEAFTKWHGRTRALRTVNYDAAWNPQTNDYDGAGMAGVLKKMLDISKGAGFTVGVEDWPRNEMHLNDVADLCDIPHYGVLIDLGHMNMRLRGKNDPQEGFPAQNAQMYLDNIKLPVNELHIHNNDGAHDLHAPANTGTMDMRAVAGMLKAKCPGCVCTIEIVPRFCGITEDEGERASLETRNFWKQVF